MLERDWFGKEIQYVLLTSAHLEFMIHSSPLHFNKVLICRSISAKIVEFL